MKPGIRTTILIALILVMGGAGAVYAKSPTADLTETCDPVLQKGLQRSLMDLNLTRAAEAKSLSIVLVDITDTASPRMAYVNPNEMMYAASLPKIAILLGAFEKISTGQMALDAETREKSALFVATLSSFMGPFIISSVNVALPAIQEEFCAQRFLPSL